MIPMSADEIKDFWRGFCERQGVSPAVRAAGEKKIEEDPEHWADLLEVLSKDAGKK